VGLVEEILSDYLSKEELQAIARDHDLPVSRTKDEIVGELLNLDDFDPAEAVAFLSVWQLRTICQEHGMPSGAYRDALVERVITAIEEENRPRERRRRVKPAASPASPPIPPAPKASPIAAVAPPPQRPIEVVVPPSPPPPIRVHVQPAPSTPIEVQVHPSPPPQVQVRVLSPQTAAWGFVGVVAAAVFGGIYFATTTVLGALWGVVVGLLAGVVAALLLLVTESRWAPKLNLLARGDRPPRTR
jgi:hypothetical protein